MKMMTRKRGRPSNTSSAQSAETKPGVTFMGKEAAIPPGVDRDIVRELSSSSNEDLELFSLDDFSWVLDKDGLAPLGDLDAFGDLKDDISVDQDYDMSPPHTFQEASTNRPARDFSSRGVNKNAIAARMNRLKKKEYVCGLEKKVGSLTTENQILKQENGHLNKRVEELENETRYLRAVLANDSMLGQLLSRLSGVNGMKFSTSLFQGSEKNDHDYAIPKKRVKVDEADTSSGGVCLHVDKDHVSVEFCTKCAESASATIKM